MHITTVTYGPNRLIGKLPAAVTLGLSGLGSGTHRLRLSLTFHRAVRQHGQGHVVSETRSLTQQIRVC